MPKAKKDADGLSPRERRFALEYLKGRNGTRAVIAAGYKNKHPADAAYWLLKEPHIRKFIDAREAELLAELDYSVSAIRERLIRIANEDVTETPWYRAQSKRMGIDAATEEQLGKLFPSMSAEWAVLRNLIKDHKTAQIQALRTLAEIAANSLNQELNERLARLETVPPKQLSAASTVDGTISVPVAAEEDAQ